MALPPLIPSTWSSFPVEFRNRLGSTVGRQRSMYSDGHLLIVAHQLPERDEPNRRGILYWREAGGEWKCSSGEPGKVALGLHLDRNAKRLDAYEQQASTAKHAEDFLPLLDGLAPIVRSNRNLLATLEEARKSVPEVRELIDHRDRAYDLSRQAELLYEDVRNSLDVAVVRRADEQAKSTKEMMMAAHRLNVMAALFFPFATLGSIFGTTLTENWSWSQSAVPFAVLVLAGFVGGIAMTAYITKKT